MERNRLLAIAIVAIVVTAGAAVALMNINQGNIINDGSETVTVKDAIGNSVTVKKEPQRIVCLSTYTCEFLILFGYTEKVVGVTSSSYTNVDQAPYFGDGKTTDVGNFNDPNLDRIVDLKPDLIITWSTNKNVTESFDNLGLPYIFLQCSSEETIMEEATSLGIITGKNEIAKKFNDYFGKIVSDIDSKVSKITQKKVVYMESFSKNSAAGKNSAYYRLCVRAGADMLYKGDVSATIGEDFISNGNPAVIIKTPMLKSMINGGAKKLYDDIVSRPGFTGTEAVKNGDVYILCSQLFAGPRCFVGIVASYDAMYSDTVEIDKMLNNFNTAFGVNFSIGDLSYSGTPK